MGYFSDPIIEVHSGGPERRGHLTEVTQPVRDMEEHRPNGGEPRAWHVACVWCPAAHFP